MYPVNELRELRRHADEVPDTELVFTDPTEGADITDYELGRVTEGPVEVLGFEQ